MYPIPPPLLICLFLVSRLLPSCRHLHRLIALFQFRNGCHSCKKINGALRENEYRGVTMQDPLGFWAKLLGCASCATTVRTPAWPCYEAARSADKRNRVRRNGLVFAFVAPRNSAYRALKELYF